MTRILADTSLNFWTYDSLNWDSYLNIWVEQPLSSFLTRPTIPGIEGSDKNKASIDFYLFNSAADSLRLESPDLGHYYILADSVDDSLVNGKPLISTARPFASWRINSGMPVHANSLLSTSVLRSCLDAVSS